MQYIEPHAFYFAGFGLATLIPYLIVRATSRGKDRFRECSVILILGILVEQICAVYYGFQYGDVYHFYMNTTIVFVPAVILMSIDLLIQRLTRRERPPPKPISLDLQ